MSSLPDTKSIKHRLDLAEGWADKLRANVQASNDVPLGFEPVDDETFRGYFEAEMQKWGEAVLIDQETGQPRIANVFIAALAFADGGDEYLKRYSKIIGLGATSAA